MMWGWGHWWVGAIMMVLFWGAVIGLIVWAVRGFGPGTPRRAEPGPKDILAERYARGEISKDEFEERREVLERRVS